MWRGGSFWFNILENHKTWGRIYWAQICIKGGGGLQPDSPPQTRNLKNTDLVDIISSVLRDLPFSQNQPLKSADD
jgi:hypothetical protein